MVRGVRGRSRDRRSRTDYPAGVLAVYDNGGPDASASKGRRRGTIDRYTVVYESVEYAPEFPGGRSVLIWPYVGMSDMPFWPGGFCQHGEARNRPIAWGCGRVIPFSDLPVDCQTVVRRDLSGS